MDIGEAYTESRSNLQMNSLFGDAVDGKAVKAFGVDAW